MTPEDRSAILSAVRSFRIGAPILISDVRFACWADGHPIEHVKTREIPAVLRSVCIPENGKYGPHDYKSWIRRANE